MCILASISLGTATFRTRANQVFQAVGLLFALAYFGSRLPHPTLYAINDLFHLRESQWNLHWLLAQRMKEVGLRPGDRVAWIGNAIDAEWAILDDAKIVAE